MVGILWDEWLKSFTINYIGASERLYGCVLVRISPPSLNISTSAASFLLAGEHGSRAYAGHSQLFGGLRVLGDQAVPALRVDPFL